MHNLEFLEQLTITLMAALAGGVLARLFHLPVLIGYLFAGIALGPYTPGIIADERMISSVSTLGVALLMFAVGVQFSLRELHSVLKTALLGGGMQILGTIGLGVGLGYALGWGLYEGIFVGCALSLSSTAVMMRILEERGELGTAHGAVMLGILIVQDLSLIFMIGVLPALAVIQSDGISALTTSGISLLQGGAFIVGTLLLAELIVPTLLHRVTRTGSRELFLLTVVSLCLLVALTAEMVGLGLPLGAFVAGLVVSESPYAHEILSQIRPLRDVFASLFFMSIGMLLNISFITKEYTTVFLVVLTIIIGKGALSVLAIYFTGWHGRTAITAGLGLAQIGEFSFVLATTGSTRQLLSAERAQIIFSSALLTLFLAPFIYKAAAPLYAFLNKFRRFGFLLNRHQWKEALASHKKENVRVLLLGCGRVGRYVSDALRKKGISHIVIDYDPEEIARLRAAGVPVIYGDASSEIVLEQTSPENAELAIVALPEVSTSEIAIRTLRRLAPELPIIVRVHRGVDIPRMRKAGAEAVIHGEFEAGVEIIRQGLKRLEVESDEVTSYLDRVREHRYREEF